MGGANFYYFSLHLLKFDKKRQDVLQEQTRADRLENAHLSWRPDIPCAGKPPEDSGIAEVVPRSRWQSPSSSRQGSKRWHGVLGLPHVQDGLRNQIRRWILDWAGSGSFATGIKSVRHFHLRHGIAKNNYL